MNWRDEYCVTPNDCSSVYAQVKGYVRVRYAPRSDLSNSKNTSDISRDVLNFNGQALVTRIRQLLHRLKQNLKSCQTDHASN